MKHLENDSPTLDPKYIRKLQPDPSGGFTVTVHELPGLIAEGDTADEALSNLDSVAQSWLASARANGYPVAEPIDFDGASGKVALRISRRIHQQASERADLEGVSLNQFIGNAIASYLGQLNGIEAFATKFEQSLATSVRSSYWAMLNMQWQDAASSWESIDRRHFLVKTPAARLRSNVSTVPITRELSHVKNSKPIHIHS